MISGSTKTSALSGRGGRTSQPASLARAALRGRLSGLSGLTRLSALAALTLMACATGGPAASPTPAASKVEVAARVDGQVISLDELDQWIKDDLLQRRLAGEGDAMLYKMRKAAIERMINEHLLERAAESRGLDPLGLIEVEMAKLDAISDETVQAFYDENKERIKGDAEFEALASSIRTHLEREREAKFVTGLRNAASVTIEIEAPRATIAGSGPSRGPASAKVVIVEFSDYQCPFCRRVEPTLHEIVARYPDDVRWEFRHFPLSHHPRATPAAEAAVCAEAQGKFWEYHALLFDPKAKLDPANLRQIAEKVGLELAQFESCQQAPDTRARVADDLKAGTLAGASGTPAFFINGIFVSGALPIEEFEKLIQSELAKAN